MAEATLPPFFLPRQKCATAYMNLYSFAMLKRKVAVNNYDPYLFFQNNSSPFLLNNWEKNSWTTKLPYIKTWLHSWFIIQTVLGVPGMMYDVIRKCDAEGINTYDGLTCAHWKKKLILIN